MIDLILSRHIRVIKFSNYMANSINEIFNGFRNELVADLLIDSQGSIFDDSNTRIDKFLGKMHVKFHQLSVKINQSLNSNLDSLFLNEINFLETSFPGITYNKLKKPGYDLFGLSYKEHLSGILSNLKKEVISTFKVSIAYNHPDSFLLDQFRGSRKFNYKDSIFSNYKNKIKTFVKSIFSCYSSEIRFFFYFKSKKFPFFKEALPLSESDNKKEKSKLGVYSISDFSPREDSSSWKGCLPHFNSTVTQIPLFSLSESNIHDFRNWFHSKSNSFKKGVLGEKRFNLMSSNKYSYSQIFDFSKSSMSLAGL